jgi:hypothetical protein
MNMIGPEIVLEHPVELDGALYDKLSLSDFNALASFRTNSSEQVIRSMALCFDVPRRVIRHLHPDDANRAGDLIVSALNTIERAFNPLEPFE